MATGRKSVARAVVVALTVACVGWAGAAMAAEASPAQESERAPLTSAMVKAGLYRIDGAGGVSLLRVGDRGLVLVDAKRGGAYASLMAEVTRISNKPGLKLNAVFLTAGSPAQSGNAAQFAQAGVPVVVQKRAFERLAANPVGTLAPPPYVTFETDYELHAGDVKVEVEHVGHGRSESDSVVLFPDLRVMAVGDLYTTGEPRLDCAPGASFAGWVAQIDHLMWSEFDIAVPSSGPAIGKRELTAFKARLQALAGSPPPARTDCPSQK